MARRYGIATLDITMLPIGGLARLERMPRDPLPELWIALAGPAVNVVIALGLGIGLWINDAFDFRSTVPSDVVRESIFLQLVAINASLAIFNLLPALPMDGGRVLRSLLQLRMDRMRATQIAARVSRYLAFFMIIAGLFYGWTLTFIGVFVLIGSFQELLGARIEAINEASQSGRWIDPRAGSTSPSPYGTIFEDGPSSSGTPFFKTYTWTFGSPPSPPSPRARQQDDDDDILDATDVRRIE